MIKHTGGCHCKRVRFEVLAPAEIEVGDCNCSMCSRTGFQHLIVPKDRFKLLSGYVPRSHPDGYSVNARCLDAGTFRITGVRLVDGLHWEQHYPTGRGEFT